MKNSFIRTIAVLFILGAVVALGKSPACAATNLTITPITWGVVGLDSNNVNVGPNLFPVGARVCNTDPSNLTTLTGVEFAWDDGGGTFTSSPSANAYINLQDGTLSTQYASTPLAKSTCMDVYFDVSINRLTASYDKTRNFHITATDAGGSVSTPVPRQIYVEHLVSQNRNAVDRIWVGTSPNPTTEVLSGGTTAMVVGNEYYIKMHGWTSTNGYDQSEFYLSMPNTVLQTISVSTTYTAVSSSYVSSPNDKLYGDACNWSADPNSPTYRSCLDVGKVGGEITQEYRVKVLAAPSSPIVNPIALNTLMYDFSGSSYHYNSDFKTSTRYLQVINPAQVTIAKNFVPSPIIQGGTSALTFTITNPFSTVINDVNFVDLFPTSPGAMTLANTTTSNSCGGSLLDSGGGALNAGDVGIKLTGGTIPANGSCSITVNVTAPATGTYTNTTQHLFVGTTDTGNAASSTLTVNATETKPTTCGLEMAYWKMETSAGTGTPPAYTWKVSDVTSATASYSGTGSQSINSTDGNPVNSWKVLDGWLASGTPTGSAPYYEITIDTSKYTNVKINFDYFLGGNWASKANNEMYIFSKSDSESSFTQLYTTFTGGTDIDKGIWYNAPITTVNATGATSTQTFRISFVGQQSNSGYTSLDNIYITGCRVIDPPTITKTYKQGTTKVGDTTDLTFTITNPNQSPSGILTAIEFDDFLPKTTLTGTVAVTNNSTTITGTGTAFKSQLAAGSIINIPATPANMTGTVSVTNGSYYVIGTGTKFLTEAPAGSRIILGSGNYTVSDTVSDTYLVLTNHYIGTTAASLTTQMYMRYKVASVASDTSLTLDTTAPYTAYSGATASGVTVAAGLTLTAAPTTTCRGYITGKADGSAISLAGDRLNGLISVTNNSKAVTGTGTSFQSQLSAGSRIAINDVFYEVSAIGSDTSLTLTNAYAGATTPSPITYDYYAAPIQGTIAVTNNSAAVTGTGTSFMTQFVAGDVVYINSVRYSISSTSAITSNTSLTLSSPYLGITGSGLPLNPNYILGGTVTTNGTASVTGSSTHFSSELYAGQVIYIDGTKYTIASITDDTHLTLTTTAAAGGVKISKEGRTGLVGGGGATCTVTATVKANTSGTSTNVTGNIYALESGTNTTSSGYAVASEATLIAPVIAKQFTLNPITAGSGNVTPLTFTITNPNQTNALSGVGFTDTFPISATSAGNMTIVASPLSVTPTVTFAATGRTITRSSGSFVTDGFAVGSTISTTSGTNPGPFTIAAVSATVLTVNEAVTDQSSSSVTINKYYLSGCGSPTSSVPTAGGGSYTLAGATIAAGGTCTVTINVTAPSAASQATVASIQSDTQLTLTANSGRTASGQTLSKNGFTPVSGTVDINSNSTTVTGHSTSFQSSLAVGDVINIGTYNNTTGQVSTVINGATVYGNTATDMLTVNAVHPAISVKKQIGTSATGPWYSTLAMPQSTSVFYQFTVENTGDVPLSAFTVTDPTLVPGSPSQISCTWSQTSLPVGTSSTDPTATCVVGPVTTSAASGTNTATAHGVYNSTTYDSATSSAAYTTTGISLTKSVTESYYAAAGNVLHYSYLVTNTGTASLQGPVTVSDNKTTATCPAVSTLHANNEWLAPGEKITCTASYSVTADDVSAGTVTNTASATVSGVTSATASVTVPYMAPPTIAKAFSPLTIKQGETSTITFTLTNPNTFAPLTGASFTDGMSNMAISEYQTARGTCTNASANTFTNGQTNLSFTGITIPANSSCTVTVVVKSSVTGTNTNTVSGVSTNEAQIGAGASADLTVTAGSTDIAITKSGAVTKPSGSTCGVGCQVTYTITLTNNGPTTVTSFTVSDTWPSQLDYVSSTPAAGTSYDNSTRQWTATGLTLASGSSVTLNIVGVLNAAYSGGSFSNTATLIASDTGDTNPSNDVGTANMNPTRVSLTDFRVIPGEQGGSVVWTTASETGTLGFHLYRWDGKEKNFLPLTATLLPSLHDYPDGGTYSFRDEQALPTAASQYLLVEQETTGQRTAYGPFAFGPGPAEVPAPALAPFDFRAGAYPHLPGLPVGDGSIPDLTGVYDRTPHPDSPERAQRLAAAVEPAAISAVTPFQAKTAGKSLALTTAVTTSTGAPTAKYAVTSDGLYYLDAATFGPQLGLTVEQAVAQVAARTLALKSGGKAVAWLPAADNGGLWFWGRQLLSQYPGGNVYWLTAEPGVVMTATGGTAPTGAASPDQTFLGAVHAEQDLKPAMGTATPEKSLWYWNSLIPGTTSATQNFPLTVDQLAVGTEATLTLHLLGTTPAPNRISVALNGTPIGEGAWTGAVSYDLVLPFSSSLLLPGGNSVTLTALRDAGAPYSFIFLDAIDLAYPRSYRTDSDLLACRGDGNQPVTAAGFTGADLVALDLSNPDRPKLHPVGVTAEPGGSYQATFTPETPATPYAVTTLSRTRLPQQSGVTTVPSRLLDRALRADWVAITPAVLEPAAQRLAARRQAQGLATQVVLLDEIMDGFSTGLYRPQAIRDFLSYTARKWAKAPRFAVLIGDGSYDYQDLLGKEGNLVPPLMVATPFGAAAADSAYGDTNGNGVPEIAVGRLPVVSVAELDAVTAKIAAYEDTPRTATDDRLLLVADLADAGAGNFAVATDAVAAIAPKTITVEKSYRDQQSAAAVRSQLLTGLQSGVGFLSYAGHSDLYKLSHDGLLTVGDVPTLTNRTTLPIVVADTCYVNGYQNPGKDTLGEALVIAPQGGAVAVISSALLSMEYQAQTLALEFHRALWNRKTPTVGEALVAALQKFVKSGGAPYLADTYILLGDPATRTRMP